MSLVSGVNHVAILTTDLDRFVAFYRDLLGLEVAFSESTPAFRHAILRAGPSSWVHPVQVTGTAHGAALPRMFDRGHLDHLALTAASAGSFARARENLLAASASDGRIDDLGPFRSLWFTDPDGMQIELVLVVDPALADIHEPRPVEPA